MSARSTGLLKVSRNDQHTIAAKKQNQPRKRKQDRSPKGFPYPLGKKRITPLRERHGSLDLPRRDVAASRPGCRNCTLDRKRYYRSMPYWVRVLLHATPLGSCYRMESDHPKKKASNGSSLRCGNTVLLLAERRCAKGLI
jgi:hypothetical protein